MDTSYSNPRLSAEPSRPSADSRDRAPPSDQMTASGSRRPSGTTRICGKCGGPLAGQFVRALENTWHLECFTCHECGKIVASKFFPVPEQPPGQYPLCETDYFRRLNLLCYACGQALRGSYITALNRKYHIEHFTCSVCPTVFGASDSYYEHEGNVYCHYHYSTRFAQKCNGCQTAILKQFVEIYRNGENQHWHPECYMIHKYWNVKLYSPNQVRTRERKSIEGGANETERQRVRQDEEQIEQKVLKMWRTLSTFEESSAQCISNMLLSVSNGAVVEGASTAKKFIVHVQLLFGVTDDLDRLMISQTEKGLSYGREAKLLCKKVVAFFQLLRESQRGGVRRLGVTQELLTLVTGLAHYLKLLIRIDLQGSLRFERETGSERALYQFLDKMDSLPKMLNEVDELEEWRDTDEYVQRSADTCPICSKGVDDKCFRHKKLWFHWNCMKCESCYRDLYADYANAHWDSRDERLLGKECVDPNNPAENGFILISRLQCYSHCLRVAHARLLADLRQSSALPHDTNDPNLNRYDSNSGHRVHTNLDKPSAPLLRSDARSKSYQGRPSIDEQPSSYEETLGDIKRLRSTRMDKTLSSAMKQGRSSRVINGPDGQAPRPGSAEPSDKEAGQNSGFQIRQRDRDSTGQPMSQLTFGADSIRLDDIPRLVAAEQAREQRPNASRYARGGLMQSEPQPKMMSGHRRDTSGGQELEKLGPEGHRPKRYFSELSPIEYFIVRHVAVLSMEPLFESYFNQEELLDLIEFKKQNFWNKFGRAFNKDKPKAGRKKGIFGVALDALVERDGEECSDGVGPGALRVPAIVQDAIAAMRTMDMSMEGVFRKNGNIKKLKEMAEKMDVAGTSDVVDLNGESPVQVAALLKKFFRELPDPVMTYKLHKLFVTSQKITHEEKQRRALHLTCCLLPKAHRDTMEVLFCFLNWAASFSVVDEESGSKMDIHNLATVIAPNIMFSNNKVESMEDSFLAIEAVNQLIKYNDTMSEVPEDLQSILNDSSLFSGSADITTKEILKRYGDMRKPPQSFQPAHNVLPHASTDPTSNTSAPAPTNEPHDRTRLPNGGAPVYGRVDDAAYQANASRAETRTAMGIRSKSRGQTPPPPPHPPSSNGFYANPTSGSRDSFSADRGSPARFNRGGGREGQPQQYGFV